MLPEVDSMRLTVLTLLTLLLILLAPLGIVQAQDVPAVQELNGSLAPGQNDVFLIKGLSKSQTLTAFMENTSGNLDPFLAILSATVIFPACWKATKRMWQSWWPVHPIR
jgi:hypothetical protein